MSITSKINKFILYWFSLLIFLGAAFFGWNAYEQSALDEARENSLVVKAEATPESHTTELYKIYKELVELNPSSSAYHSKFNFYQSELEKYANQLCPQAIGLVMGRDPKIMKIEKSSWGAIFVSYARPSDNTTWDYQCMVEGNRVFWGNRDGRLRQSDADGKITFNMEGDLVEMTESFPGGATSQHSAFEIIR